MNSGSHGGMLVLLVLLTSLLSACRPMAPATPARLLSPDPVLTSSPYTLGSHRNDGTVLVNGRPFFPFGFYYLSWSRYGTVAQRQMDLQRLAHAGFNLLITEPANDQDAHQFGLFLEEARKVGVYIIPNALPLAVQKEVADAPALLGFAVADDANALSSPQKVREETAAAKRVAPDKLTYLSLSVAYDRPETGFFSAGDLVANQSYPIGNDDISVVYPTMLSAVQTATSQGSVPLANLQSFLWGIHKPSTTELRNMTYQALLAGVKGIVYYAYRSPQVDLNGETALWAMLQQLSGEVAVLAPYLMNGELIPLSAAKNTPLLAFYLRGEDEAGQPHAYLICLSTQRRARLDVQVSLPEEPTRWEGLHTGNALSHNGTSVSGKLEPLGVAVYAVR